jgi:hypothetical protein
MNKLEVAINSYYSKNQTSSDESIYAMLVQTSPSRKTSQSFAMSLDNNEIDHLERQLQAKTFEAQSWK